MTDVLTQGYKKVGRSYEEPLTLRPRKASRINESRTLVSESSIFTQIIEWRS
jgi:hypothetical protein